MRLEQANIPEFESVRLQLPQASFIGYQPDLAEIRRLAERCAHFRNLLIVGHGGSISSFIGIYGALADLETPGAAKRQVRFVQSTDPDFISSLRHEFKPEHTLVLAISKSGETVTQIEALLQFPEYKKLFITGKTGPLAEIAKATGADVLLHPDIGGRYTGLTEVALLPAAICGFDIDALLAGGREVHGWYAEQSETNPAWVAAQILWALEQRGYADVFVPFYSHGLAAMQAIIVQLCHESFGKNRKGQTFLGMEAPESQHHTNQRFFGGIPNICGFFQEVKSAQAVLHTRVPENLRDIKFKDGRLSGLSGISLQDAMHAEYQGTWQNAKIQGIPLLGLELPEITAGQLGQYMAFWQLFAVYSAVLRGSDPFDQPQVEAAKIISWNERKKLHAN